MAGVGISETQFAFTFFHKFCQFLGGNVHHIVALSTSEEGNSDSDFRGTDLVIDNYFLQFKLPHFIERKHVSKSKFRNNFNDSYFWFPIYNGDSDGFGQFDFLKDHCSDPAKQVYYVSPSFSDRRSIQPQATDFWYYDFFRADPKAINEHLAIVDVRDLPWIWQRGDEHHIAYNHDANHCLAFSKPAEIRKRSLDTYEPRPLFGRPKSLEQTKREMVKIINAHIKNEERLLTASSYTITELQLKTLVEFNVFWVPVLRKNSAWVD